MLRERVDLLNEFSSTSKYIGRWVQVPDNDLGFGRCTEKRPDGAVVVYTDIPGVATTEVVVPVASLALPRISRGTRVWLPSQTYGWYSAEIVSPTGFNEYWVRIAGESQNVKVASEKLMIRWKQPLRDPLEALAHGFCDSPEYYSARSPFIDQLLRQRATSRGFTAALSAPVELYQHQLDTVARVLADPVMRYLLADEVGLGKTIEAGLIVRQLLLDDPTTSVLVSAPTTLLSQWREEMSDRLLLASAMNDGRLQIISHEDMTGRSDLLDHRMVVVDEAHRLTKRLTGSIRRDLQKSQGLLLLSATPMRGELDTFLGLLNLIDSTAFPVGDVAAFRERVEQRESSANGVQVLASNRASLRQRRSALRQLEDLHGTDPTFTQLAGVCRESEGPDSSSWSTLAEYVRETYRISRRMIRHRRNVDITRSYPVSGRRVTFVPIVDPARPIIDDFLDRYREHFIEQSFQIKRRYTRTVLEALSGPKCLIYHLEVGLGALPTANHAIPTDMRPVVEATLARLRLMNSEVRFDRALDLIDTHLNADHKVMVVGTSRNTAAEFQYVANLRWPGRVWAHLASMEQRHRDENVLGFLAPSSGQVLVADDSVEEGRNLQDAHVLVNLDLPLDPNRLEQRIGRLDRFAKTAKAAEVVVFTEPDSEWQSAHIALLNQGIGIFEFSVATLQRKLTHVLHQLINTLPRDGSSAFTSDLPTLRDELETEQTEVDLLEELESITVAADFDDLSLADFRKADDDVESLRSAFSQLTSLRGGISLRPNNDERRGLVKFDHEQNQRRLSRTTVISGLSEDASQQVIALLAEPRAYARDVAASRSGVPLLRLGDPLVNWIDRYLRHDERGRTRAIIRPSRHVHVPELWLACDFLIEFDDIHLHEEKDGVRRRLRRRGDAHLPPSVVRTWSDVDAIAPSHLVEEVLESPFDTRRDVVLRGTVWKDVRDEMPDWTQLCRISFDVAKRHLDGAPCLTDLPAAAARRAEREVAARLGVLSARSRRLSTEAERASAAADMNRERVLGSALVKGVAKPAASVIACGAVVLWPGHD